MSSSIQEAAVFLAIALGCEERCRPEIDRVYSTNERMYLEVYDDTGIEFTNVFSKFTLTTSDYIKKAFSILVLEQLKGSDLVTIRLIKKGYKSAYNFFTQRKKLAVELFTAELAEKSGGLENLSGLYLDRSYMVIYFLSEHYKKPIMETPVLMDTKDRYGLFFLNIGIDDVDMLERDSKNNSGYEDLLALVIHNNHVADSVSTLFEDAKLNEELKILDTGFKSNKAVLEYLSSSPTGRIINISYILLELFGISGDIFGDAKISKDRLTALAKYVQTISNENKMPKREAEIVFLMSLVMYSLTQEYDNVRRVHYAGAKSSLTQQELEHERRVLSIKESFEKERNKLRDEIKELKLSNETFKRALKQNSTDSAMKFKELDIENKKLQSELDKAKEQEKELEFLRKFYQSVTDNSGKNSDNVSVNSIEAYKQDLNSLKGVLVGGHANVQRKLKEQLPSFVFITPDDLNRNLTYIRNYDILYFYSEHNNHSMFKKLMPVVKSSNIVLSFVSSTTNTDLLIKEMYEQASEEGLLVKV